LKNCGLKKNGGPMNDLQKLVQKVGQIYAGLDAEIKENKNLSPDCIGCGECCDFERFGHLLFVTTPELIFLKENIAPEKIKTMQTSICPYQKEGKCTIYPFRFAGCRIFFCRGDKDFQSRLSESAVKTFKTLCTEFSIPYIYSDLKQALKNSAGQNHPCRTK
jgi:Fe-S-cluster containining protein